MRRESRRVGLVGRGFMGVGSEMGWGVWVSGLGLGLVVGGMGGGGYYYRGNSVLVCVWIYSTV